MLAEATSLADFFRKAGADDRYKGVAVTAYQLAECVHTGGWKDAERWINNWVRDYVKPNDPRSK